MRIQIVMLLCAAALIPNCSKSAEEPAAPEAAVPATAPTEPVAVAESTPAPETATPAAPAETAAPAGAPADAAPAVVLPEGFTSRFHVHPEMVLSSVEVLNADEGQYKVTGELRASASQVLNYFVTYFQDNGWEEDMIMEQEGNTVVSFKKDGYLQYIDSHEGGIGAKIAITTGKV